MFTGRIPHQVGPVPLVQPALRLWVLTTEPEPAITVGGNQSADLGRVPVGADRSKILATQWKARPP